MEIHEDANPDVDGSPTPEIVAPAGSGSTALQDLEKRRAMLQSQLDKAKTDREAAITQVVRLEADRLAAVAESQSLRDQIAAAAVAHSTELADLKKGMGQLQEKQTRAEFMARAENADIKAFESIMPESADVEVLQIWANKARAASQGSVQQVIAGLTSGLTGSPQIVRPTGSPMATERPLAEEVAALDPHAPGFDAEVKAVLDRYKRQAAR